MRGIQSLVFVCVLAASACGEEADVDGGGEVANNGPANNGNNGPANNGNNGPANNGNNGPANNGNNGPANNGNNGPANNGNNGVDPARDSFDDAEMINLGDGAVRGVIEAPGDRDYFRFEAMAGEWLYIDVDANPQDEPGLLDTVITLYDAAMTQVAQNDDAQPRTGPDPELIYRAPMAGTYYIRVLENADWRGQEPNGQPDFVYELAVSRIGVDLATIEVERGDDVAAAKAITLANDFALVVGTWRDGMDTDVFSFTMDRQQGNLYRRLAVDLMPTGVDGYGGTSPSGGVWVTDLRGERIEARINQEDGQTTLSPPLRQGRWLLWAEHGAAAAGPNDFYVMKVRRTTENTAETENGGSGNDSVETAEAVEQIDRGTTRRSAFVGPFLDAGVCEGGSEILGVCAGSVDAPGVCAGSIETLGACDGTAVPGACDDEVLGACGSVPGRCSGSNAPCTGQCPDDETCVGFVMGGEDCSRDEDCPSSPCEGFVAATTCVDDADCGGDACTGFEPAVACRSDDECDLACVGYTSAQSCVQDGDCGEAVCEGFVAAQRCAMDTDCGEAACEGYQAGLSCHDDTDCDAGMCRRDVDVFSMEVRRGGISMSLEDISVACTSANAGSGVLDMHVEILDPDGELIAEATEAFGETLFINQAEASAGPGTYYVRLSKSGQVADVAGTFVRCGFHTVVPQ